MRPRETAGARAASGSPGGHVRWRSANRNSDCPLPGGAIRQRVPAAVQRSCHRLALGALAEVVLHRGKRDCCKESALAWARRHAFSDAHPAIKHSRRNWPRRRDPKAASVRLPGRPSPRSREGPYAKTLLECKMPRIHPAHKPSYLRQAAETGSLHQLAFFKAADIGPWTPCET